MKKNKNKTKFFFTIFGKILAIFGLVFYFAKIIYQKILKRDTKTDKTSVGNVGYILIALSYLVTLFSVLIYIFKIFNPHHVIAAIATYLLNWVFFIIGTWKSQKKYLKWIQKKKKMFIIISIILVTVYLFFVFIPFGRADFLFSSKTEINKKVTQDLMNLEIYVKGLEITMDEITNDSEIFNVNSLNGLKEADKNLLLQRWSNYLDYQISLNKLVDEYKYFYQINYFLNKDLHARAFFVGYSAYIASYENGIQMVDLVGQNSLIETILNDRNIKLGISDGMYSHLKWNVLHLNDVLRLTAGYGNLKFLDSVYEKNNNKDKYSYLFKYIDKAFKDSTGKLKDGAAIWFPVNAINVFKEKSYTAWFPIQKGVATQMGNTRLTSRHDNFVTESQIIEMKKNMNPGDIILERRNWYTSNMGIPGFWPHVALYVGDWEEFQDYFSGNEIDEYLAENNFLTIDKLVRDANQEFYNDYKKNKFDVIEAIAPGVVLNTLNKSAKADYVGVVRPKLKKEDKLKALLFSMTHYKKEYDYNFNFITDSQLVCSEFAYKTYNSFINLDLVSHAGRSIYTATQFAEKFDQEYNLDTRELDFVYFLDGKESLQKAVVATEDDFRKTWERPKWELALE